MMKTENCSGHDNSKCEFCKNFHEFEIPDHLMDQLQAGKVVLFAGAGISTEGTVVFPSTFYEAVHGALDLDGALKPPFSRLMSMFCDQPDGRTKLIQLIHQRLRYVEAFPELYQLATTFHHELSTLFYIDTIITTNWDDFFERECGAVALSTPGDFALWNVRGRKVYKIHGSANHVSSLIATDEDYAKAKETLEKGALGSALKLSLATKTILYVGYSISDNDVVDILTYLRNEMGPNAPQAYIVTLDKASERRFKEMGLHPIYTDGAYFLRVIKRHLEKDEHFLSDARFPGVLTALMKTAASHARLHNAFPPQIVPEMIYSAAYQDGLKHGFERIIRMRRTGEYSHRCNVAAQARNYARLSAGHKGKGKWVDVAYIEGYISSLLFLLGSDTERKRMPMYYLPGGKEVFLSFQELRKAVKRRKRKSKFIELAARIVKRKLGPGDEFHHRPFINTELSAKAVEG